MANESSQAPKGDDRSTFMISQIGRKPVVCAPAQEDDTS
jgi:hypothetical protein